MAGNYEIAKDVLRTLRLVDISNLDSLIRMLRTASKRNAPDQVDFILATLSSHGLYEIKDGSVTVRDEAWIGDFGAFRKFETYRAEWNEKNSSTLTEENPRDYRRSSAVSSALSAVVEDTEVESVGELVVSVVPAENGFITHREPK